MIATLTGYTPPGLVFDEPTHRYTLDGRALVSVTGALRSAGLVDVLGYTDAARERGTLVHAAIALLHECGTVGDVPAIVEPYLCAYQRFLADAAFRIDASEERLADGTLGVAGTLDLRGQFVGALHDAGRVDVLDVKTGSVPPWVGYQTAGYVRMLPPDVRRRARRWCLHLCEHTGYRLIPLVNRSDEAIFLAAVTVANARRGWR